LKADLKIFTKRMRRQVSEVSVLRMNLVFLAEFGGKGGRSRWCRVYTLDKPQQTFGANAEYPKVRINLEEDGKLVKRVDRLKKGLSE
jgi:hypothetical protein